MSKFRIGDKVVGNDGTVADYKGVITGEDGDLFIVRPTEDSDTFYWFNKWELEVEGGESTPLSKFKVGDIISHVGLFFQVIKVNIESSGIIVYKLLDKGNNNVFDIYENYLDPSDEKGVVEDVSTPLSKYQVGGTLSFLDTFYQVAEVTIESSGKVMYGLIDNRGVLNLYVYEDQLDAKDEPTHRELPDVLQEAAAAVAKGNTSGGTKHDQGKPDLSLIHSSLVNAAARALMFGAEKYGRDNYKQGLDVNRVYASLLRHLFARMSGEIKDPESGLDHLDHIAANVQFLTYFNQEEK